MKDQRQRRVRKTPEPRETEHCTKKRPGSLFSICASDQMFARQSLQPKPPPHPGGNLLVVKTLEIRPPHEWRTHRCQISQVIYWCIAYFPVVNRGTATKTVSGFIPKTTIEKEMPLNKNKNWDTL